MNDTSVARRFAHRRSRWRTLLAGTRSAGGRRPASGKRLELCRARYVAAAVRHRRNVERLARLITRYAPRCVVALGDSFHDGGGPARLRPPTAKTCAACNAAATGSGSPAITIRNRRTISAARFTTRSALGALTFRHLPSGADGEIGGHLHPVARVAHRGRAVSRRCFAADKTRMVMPAFGAFTGGLNVRDAAFADLFGTLAFTAHMLGEGRLYAFAAKRCLPD